MSIRPVVRGPEHVRIAGVCLTRSVDGEVRPHVSGCEFLTQRGPSQPLSHSLASVPQSGCWERRSKAGVSSPFPWMIGRPGRRHAPLNVSDSCRLACRRWSGLPGFAIEMPLPCPSSKLASTYLLILDSTYCLSHVHGAFPCLPASASAQPSTWNALPWPSPPGVVEPTSLPSCGLRHPNRQLSHNHSCRHRARPFPVRGVSRALGKHLRTGGKSSLCLVIVIGISSSSGNSAVAGFRRLGLPRPWQDAGLWMCRCSPLSDDPFPLLCLLDAPLFTGY